MKNFNNIEGWFSSGDCGAYLFLINHTPENGLIIEVGSWLGKSSSFLVDNKKSTQKVICVDTWKGSANELTTTHRLATQTDIFEIFKLNMGDRDYSALRLPSVEAAKSFKDESLDVVFIDAEHTYEAVRDDINAWYPKVKLGGYIAGHDYTPKCGVPKAVNEKFRRDQIISGIYGSCWLVKKETVE